MAEDYRQLFDLTGRVAVVTGASEGIGRGLSVGLAAAGADLVICARRDQLLKEVQAEIKALGRRAEVFALDVTQVSAIRELHDFCLDRYGKVDVLVNNAGFAVTKPAWDVTEAEYDQMLDVGLKGLFFSCQIVGSIMREQGYGKIVNLSSTFAKSTLHGRAVYAAFKAGVSHLTEALAMEWGPAGIRVNAIGPTATATPSRMQLLQPGSPVYTALVSRIPLGRIAQVDDIVPAAIYLASPASDFITGQTIFVDGGFTTSR